MIDSFNTLYDIIFNTGLRTNKKLRKHTFVDLGSNDPNLLEDTDDCDDVLDRLTYKKIVYHDQEPIMFSAFEKSWLRKIYSINRLETNHILSNSELNSIDKDKLLEKSGWHDFYWFSNGFLSLEWYRYYKYAHYFEDSWEPTKTFSSYNRILPNREHRLVIANHLQTKYPDQIILSRHFEPNAPDNLFINTTSIQSENLSYAIHEKDFLDSFCHVITERIFFEDRIHLTEKTFRPIVCCRPFLLVSSPGSLAYLKRYGFKTFNEFWSEDYDNITDHNARLDAILDVIDHLGSLNQQQILDMLQKMQTILLYNRQHFYGDFQKIIADEMYANLAKALAARNNTKNYYDQIMDCLTDAEYELVKNSTDVCDEIDTMTPKVLLFTITYMLDNKPKDNYVRPFVKQHLKYYAGFYSGTVHIGSNKR